MTANIVSTRMANALFSNAKMNATVGAVLGGELSPVAVVLDRYAQSYGGLWVGGKATLTDMTIGFVPNGLNKMMHQNGDDLRFEIPLTAVHGVSVRKAFVTNIVDIAVDGGQFSFRCYGAKDFAAEIRRGARL